VGDAAFEVAPLLWNRRDEAISSADLGTHLRWRADVVTGWVVVRELVEAVERRPWRTERSHIGLKSPRLWNRHLCHVHEPT